MRKVIGLAVALVVLHGSPIGAQDPTKSPQQTSIPSAIVHTLCVPQVGFAVYCNAGDGPWVSLNGGAWQPMISAAPVGIVKTVQGHLPDASGNVALTVSASIP